MEKKSRLRIAFIGLISCVLLLTSNTAWSQPDTAAGDSNILYLPSRSGVIFQATVVDGDTIPWMVLDNILIVKEATFDSEEARRRYYILKRRVIRAYPYAVLAGDKLDSLNLRLDSLDNRRERRRHIKDYQEFLEERFEPELRKLTRSEGQILCKLIYRETGMSVYDLISEYRSGWTAFWFNISANWYDISLKKPYKPEEDEEDKLIEKILKISFAEGSLKERVPFYPPPAK